MAAGAFTQEQIRHFRQVYFQYSQEGALSYESYRDAVGAALQRANLSSFPPAEVMDGEFARLSAGSGSLGWQQFFQILMHFNITYGHGADLPASQPAPQAGLGVREAEEGVREAEEGVIERNHGVSFSEVVEDREPSAPPPPPGYAGGTGAWGRTLRRGGVALGRAVGNFFGVTDESQHGSATTVGWEAVSVNRAEESGLGFLTLSRRPSRRPTYDASEPPPAYPDIVPAPGVGVAGARSFDPAELSDSDEDDAFITRAPPDYSDVVQQPPPVQLRGSDQQSSVPTSGVTRISVYPDEEEQQVYPPPTQPARRPQQPPAHVPAQPVPRDDLIYDKQQALEYYLRFIKAERRLRQRRNRDQAYSFFGGEGGVDVTAAGDFGTQRRGRLQSVDQPPARRQRRPKNTKLQRQSTLVRHKVESLPSFWPVFIVVVSLAQTAGLIVLLSVYGADDGLAPIKIAPEEHRGTYPSLSTPSEMDNITYYRAVNLWIGLTPPQLIRIGAKFTPCMRTDFEIRRRNTRINDQTRGCCRNRIYHGTTVAGDCAATFATNSTNTVFDSNYTCSDPRSPYFPPNVFHPCCISITGLCQVMSEDECDDRNGWFNPEYGDCSEVNCFESICGFSGTGVGDGGNPTLPTANQFWRWVISIFIHLGVIHLVLVMPIQLYVGIKIERTIGWLRIGLIYIISGVGGNIVSGIFIPYEVNAGASGAVFGLLGVLFVELFQFWQIVDRAYLELLKLTAFVVFLLALGTLPYVDNMAHIGGLAFGVVSAIIFVPYITFGKWDAFRKRVLLLICLPLLIAMFVTGFLTFYLIPNPDFCPECQFINCVPYTSDLCPDEYNEADPEVFSL